MDVSKLKEELFRLLVNSRGRRNSATSQYILGNMSIIDGGTSTFTSIPNLEVVYFEVSSGGITLEILKVEQHQNPQAVIKGQLNVMLRNIFAYLKISEMHTDTQDLDAYVQVLSPDELPNFRDEKWQRTIWSLDGFATVQLFTNSLWRRELDDESSKMEKSHQQPHQHAAAALSGDYASSARSGKSSSIPTPPLAPQPAPVVGSFGSLKTGTSPGWFPSLVESAPPDLQLAPSTLEGAALRPLVDVPFSPGFDERRKKPVAAGGGPKPQDYPTSHGMSVLAFDDDDENESAETRLYAINDLCDRTTMSLPDVDTMELLSALVVSLNAS